MKKKVTVTFEMQSDRSYSCIVNEKFPKYGLIGYGTTARDAESDVFTGIDELKKELGPDEVTDIEITHKVFDVGSFFSYYNYINMTQFAKHYGLNASQLRQYASGARQPSQNKLAQITDAVCKFCEDMNNLPRVSTLCLYGD